MLLFLKIILITFKYLYIILTKIVTQLSILNIRIDNIINNFSTDKNNKFNFYTFFRYNL